MPPVHKTVPPLSAGQAATPPTGQRRRHARGVSDTIVKIWSMRSGTALAFTKRTFEVLSVLALLHTDEIAQLLTLWGERLMHAGSPGG